MTLFVLNLVLALAWAAVTGTFTLFNLLFGWALGFVALWLPRALWGEPKYFRRAHLVLGLLAMFLTELVKSSLRVARDVLRPGFSFRPGVIAIPLTVDRDLEITLLANLITLTPGTLSVDVASDRSILYVHAMDVADAEALRREIKNGFERKILEALR